jgi:16S rRNA (cytidine1402-2'-O)-methyltransferase
VAVLESPFRVVDTIKLIAEIAPENQLVLAREMTKVYEEFVRGPARSVAETIQGRSLKGEMVIVVEGGPVPKGGQDETEPQSEEL